MSAYHYSLLFSTINGFLL